MHAFAVMWVVFSAAAAVIASHKGRSAVVFFLVSLLLSPFLGLIAAMIVTPNAKLLERQQGDTGGMKQ